VWWDGGRETERREDQNKNLWIFFDREKVKSHVLQLSKIRVGFMKIGGAHL
jgi:hypothetical protein